MMINGLSRQLLNRTGLYSRNKFSIRRSLNFTTCIISLQFDFSVSENVETANVSRLTVKLAEFCNGTSGMSKRHSTTHSQKTPDYFKSKRIKIVQLETCTQNMGDMCSKCAGKSYTETEEEYSEKSSLISDKSHGSQSAMCTSVNSGPESIKSEKCEFNDESTIKKSVPETSHTRNSRKIITELVPESSEPKLLVKENSDVKPKAEELLTARESSKCQPEGLVSDSEILAKKSKRSKNPRKTKVKAKSTVLPKEMLENITSIVSEKCEKDEGWRAAIRAGPSTDTESEVFGELFTSSWGEDAASTNIVQSSQSAREEDGKQSKKKKKPKKEKAPPNYFIAVQITNPEIHCALSNIQMSVLGVDPRMKDVMNRLSTLHLTVLVLSLNSDEDIARAGSALESCQSELRERFKEALPVLEVEGLGTFRNQVVFAKVKPGEGLDHLMFIHECVKRTMLEQGVRLAETAPMTPHITIMKMSKVRAHFRKNVAKRIEPELYSQFQDDVFGRETVESLQLCAMLKPKDKLGYYQVPHTLWLAEGEPTVEDFSHSLSKSVVASAMDKIMFEKIRGSKARVGQRKTETKESTSKHGDGQKWKDREGK